MSEGVSVVICTYNGAKRLPKTLGHLATQKIPSGIPWEIIVVDNASTDETAATVLNHQPVFTHVPLRLVSEPLPGLSNARICGIRAAQYDIISQIDDDNWVAADWIERVSAIFSSHPEISACGGRSDAVYEIAPPSWVESIKGLYAVGSQFPESGEVTHRPGTLLWGAGSNFKSVELRALLDEGFTFFSSGRRGLSLSGGEDTELCFALRERGSRFWYDDDLVLQHFIPKERLQWCYLLRLMRAMGRSSEFFELYLAAVNRAPFNYRSPWKKTWLYAYLRAGSRLASVALKHPFDCLRLPEGSTHALVFEQNRGRWEAVQALRSRYESLAEDILKTVHRQPHHPM